jgi:DNA-binding MarR family transcriptional regulator
MTSATSEDITRKIVTLIRQNVRLWALHTRELSRNYDLSVSQLLCLQTLHENGRMSMSDIAESIMVNVSTVTGIVDRLERKGLIERQRETTDRRVITIALTEKGTSLAENSPPAVHHKIVRTVQMLSEAEREEVFDALDSVSRLIHKGGPDHDPALPSEIDEPLNSLAPLQRSP